MAYIVIDVLLVELTLGRVYLCNVDRLHSHSGSKILARKFPGTGFCGVLLCNQDRFGTAENAPEYKD